MAPPESTTSDRAGLLWLHEPPARSIRVAGGKAAHLAQLIAADFAVPDGLVIPISAERSGPIAQDSSRALATAVVERMGPGPFAIRSSATGEDGTNRSWAGMFETVLNVTGVEGIAEALVLVSASGQGSRAQGYDAGDPGGLAVLVQPMVDARIAGVAFTSGSRVGAVERSVTVTAVDGPAEQLVSGQISGEEWAVRGDVGTRYAAPRTNATEDDMVAVAALATSVADHFGVPQDIEWAIGADQLWLLQARPLTAPFPQLAERPPVGDANTLVGIAASPGRATGPARIVRDVGDLGRIRPGDVLVTPTTSPGWTPVFADIAAVVTDIGSAAAHAAIVAREFAIPAVTDTGDASTRLRDNMIVTVDGTHGTVHLD